MMLPTDLALIQDPQFRPFVEMYANDQALFFRDFAQDYAKLIHNGCPAHREAEVSPRDQASADLREAAMHGSIGVVKELAAQGADVHGVEASSGRTALHKAAFWGHEATVGFLLNEGHVNPNVQDYNGDTALHDAARFGHVSCVNLLLAGTDLTLRNKEGKTPLEVAEQYQQPKIVALLNERSKL
jgi:ankyrin repeat protein